MNKQTKQLAILGGLVVVAGIVAYFFVLKPKEPTPTPAANTPAPAAAATTPNAAPTAPGQPNAAPAPAGTPGAAPVAVLEPLPMPKDEPLPVISYTWVHPMVEKGTPIGGFNFDWKKNGALVFDPMHVQNLDVVAPERRLYIEKIRTEWVIEGITITPQMVLKVNDKGEPELDEKGQKQYEKKDVKEAWFKGKRRPYKVGERLTGTRFSVEEIIQTRDKTSVKLRGDNQEELELELATPGRYPD